MTEYKFQGIIVDMKADNRHGSGRVAATISNNDLAGDALQISAGAVVVEDSNGKLDIGAANSKNVVGIATQTRAANDVRPLTYTRNGLVHAIKDAGAVATGDALKLGAQGMVTVANTDTEGELVVGKAMSTNAGAVGTVIVMEITL